jgi:adenine-specific DNA-methyltransferase
MTKPKMHTPDLVAQNIEWVAARFPGCITESRNEKGEVVRAVDFDLLRQELSKEIVEGPQERYHLNWPGKREALLMANAPIAKTLRPCREESVDFDTTRNLFIEGDNLDALKLLQETYLNKIKMIYIDPPYNTGHDFIYRDHFATHTKEYLISSGQLDDSEARLVLNPETEGRFHSAWLCMMYPRLRLARNLLADDGLILISVDENEHANLLRLCCEVFGESNHVETIVWKKRYGAGGGTKGFARLHEYILVFSRQPLESVEAPLSDEQIAEYKLTDEFQGSRGPYITQPLATSSKGERANLGYTIYHDGHEIKPKQGARWLWSEEKFLDAYKNNQVVINQSESGWSVRFKQYLRHPNGAIRHGKPLSIKSDVFNQEGTSEVAELFGEKGVFDFPKPTALLKYLFSMIVNGDESRSGVYLDFFAGSGSTAHALMELNREDGGTRRCVSIQLDEATPLTSVARKRGYSSIAAVARARIRLAADKIRNNLELGQECPDLGFRAARVESSSMKDVYYRPDETTPALLDGQTDNIKEDRTDEDLLFQVLLDWGVDLSLPIAKEELCGKVVYFVDTNALVACFALGLDEAIVKVLASRRPLRAVFRDAGYGGDDVKINVEQIFRQLSPGTEVKTL